MVKTKPDIRDELKRLKIFISKNKKKYIGKFFGVQAEHQLPSSEEEINHIKDLFELMTKRITIISKIESLSVDIENFNFHLIEFPVIKISYKEGGKKRNLLLTEGIFKEKLIIGETYEDVKNTLELMDEVK